MKYIFSITLLLFISINIQATSENSKNGKLIPHQLFFTQNKGQVTDLDGRQSNDVLFTTYDNSVKVFLNKNGVSYQFQKNEYPEGYNESNKCKIHSTELDKKIITKTYRMDMELVGSKLNPTIETNGESQYVENFYLKQCPNGILNVPTYTKIIYKEVYPKIDWVIYTNGSQVKYDFLVHVGGDPEKIKILYKNATSIQIMGDGSIKASTTLGNIIDNKPFSYQKGKEIKSSYILKDGIVAYELGEYDFQEDLIIDPGVVWSTYYGGGGDEYGKGVSVDATGNIYYAGSTSSTTGIASAGFLNSFSGVNKSAFLVKFNSSGARQWATYYGSDYTEGSDVVLDASGNVYLGGETQATTGIASGGFQSTISEGYDAFLVKFNSNGARIWGTYFGGGNGSISSTGAENCSGLATDASGNVYMTGYTQSTYGIASGGYQNTFIGDSTVSTNSNCYLVKFNSSGNRIWSTYYGGSGLNSGYDVAIDLNGDVYLCGITPNTNGIASGGSQITYGGGTRDGFLAKFNSAGNRLWSTYYGGAGQDWAESIVIDNIGNVYLAGTTESLSGIATGGFQNTYGGGTTDGFLAKFNSAGNRLWATYYGGSSGDGIENVTMDNAGFIYCIGRTSSLSNIALGSLQNNYGGGTLDALLVKFNNLGNRVGASYFGGSASENGTAIATSGSGDIYIGGRTQSTSGISYSGFQNTIGGGYDAFLAKLDDCAFFGYDTIKPILKACEGENTTISVNGGTSYLWSNGGNTASITVAPTQTTSYTVTVTNSSNCTTTASRTIYVYPNTLNTISADGIIKSIDTITSGDVVQLQLNGVLNSVPNIVWTPTTNISNINSLNPLVFPSNTTTYTVSYTDTNGCRKSKSILIYVRNIPTAGNISITSPNSTISLFDTLYISVQLSSASDLYGLYMKLKGNAEVGTYLNYAGYTAGTLLGTGSSIISTPPTVVSGIYDFGITKIGAVSGFSGAGVFYTLKFVTKNTVIPNGTNFCFYLDNISANISSGASAGLVNQGPYCYTFSDQVNVWPGDLNNSKTVTTADLLPIGYFYNATGTVRQNASLQWVAQPSTLWGYGQTYPNGSAYKVFADANGDGIISNADQTAIGFNIGKNHPLGIKKENHERSAFDGQLLLTMTPSIINSTQLPQTSNIKVELKNDNGSLNSFYGISFNIIIDSTVYDPYSAVFNYTGSIFGTNAGTDFLKIEYVTPTTISVGMTRYANAAINGNGLLCNIQLKTLSTLPLNKSFTNIRTMVEEANNAVGSTLQIKDDSIYTVAISQPNGLYDLSNEQLYIYPNPVDHLLQLHAKELIGEVRIYDALGKFIFNINQPKNNGIDVSKLSSGVYIAEIKTENGTAIRKWVKE